MSWKLNTEDENPLWRQYMDELEKMNTEEQRKILEAKRRLFLLLMKLNEDTITDNEVDIMFLLSKDEQIQSLFETHKKK